MDLIKDPNVQFIIGDVIVPLGIFALGFFFGKEFEHRKAKSKIKGNNNTVIQNSEIKK